MRVRAAIGKALTYSVTQHSPHSYSQHSTDISLSVSLNTNCSRGTICSKRVLSAPRRSLWHKLTFYHYYYYYFYYCYKVDLSRPPMALFLQPTVSSIAAGKQSLGTTVSASNRSTDVRACPLTFRLPCFGSHRIKSLTTSFLLL